VKICNQSVEKVKNMVSQVVRPNSPRVVRPNSWSGPNLSWKRTKKEPKGQTKIFGPTSAIWNQISEIWPQKGQPGNPAPQSQPGKRNTAHCDVTAHHH